MINILDESLPACHFAVDGDKSKVGSAGTSATVHSSRFRDRALALIAYAEKSLSKKPRNSSRLVYPRKVQGQGPLNKKSNTAK
jgi:hypothetical protein